MKLKIRPASKKDFEDVAEFCWKMHDEAKANPDFGDWIYHKRADRKAMAKWFNTLNKDVKDGNALYYLAEVDGKAIGQCFVRRESPGSEISHVGILGILIDRDYRRMGIGKKLLEFTIKKSKGNFEILHLRVLKNNPVARRMYKNYGFKSFGIAPAYVKRRDKYIDREFMYLKL